MAKIFKRDDLLPEQYQITRICSDRFVCGFPSKLYDVNNPDWTPSIKLGYESNSVGRAMVQLFRAERYERALKRQRVSVEDDDKVVTLSLEEESTCTTPSVDNLLAMDTCSSTAVQTDLSFDKPKKDYAYGIFIFCKHYPKCVVIIDCFEIFLDRLTNLLA